MQALDDLIGKGETFAVVTEPTNVLFHNVVPTTGTEERQFEKPWHRIALMLLAQGEPAQTVAQLCGKHVASVHQLCRTAWFQMKLDAEIRNRAGTGLVEQFQADCAMARAVENELLANPKTPSVVRAGIAKTKIERVYGKAKQLVEFDNVTQSANPVEEAAELERSIARDVAALGLPQTPSGQS